MSSLLTAFFVSFIATFLIIRFKHLHSGTTGDFDLSGPQKFHTIVVPRIGGVSIALSVLCAILLKLTNSPNYLMELTLLVCAIPTFLIGLAEDLTKKISVKKRLFFTAVSAALAIYLLQAQVVRLDIPVLDIILALPGISAIFTIFAITGVANAYNIIDGFNGLASMVGIITLLALAYLGYVFSDYAMIYLALVMAAAILGFFIWNYPRGLIFLGDGGAYLIGFWIATLSVMLTSRHPEVSPWFALLINGYPILETLFTIYRRKIHQGKSPGQPDGIHFHTLIYRRVLSSSHQDKNWFSTNARTAPYLWILAVISVTPAILWWQSSTILMIATLLFTIIYVWTYTRIVKFKTPKCLHL
ncbi:glycosyltransferase family 4 protein [Polynucleobacter sp. MWH-Braz-FAM2G]|uniref:glycosyltransferase family 4 protein n=1 Tax=Polynucleobacter sp. MWH-Braz-FAM2G TaxID=1855883 RepID=UPI001BFEB2FC|nr:glycosyltransferase [Polynucleobacter sp. MWH-Braz-FAM2G]QWD91109.1 glycosyltransferase family 4 protein [Polynucleobacter sp. MWH-Braz-FAM2G]